MTASLTRALIEVEQYVADDGWGQPPRLFALVSTAQLVERSPGLAAALGLTSGAPDDLTPVEQEAPPADAALDDHLAQLAWPGEVVGCALVVERLVLPPDAAEDAPDDEHSVATWVESHPDRAEGRLAVAVLRDGAHECAVRMREPRGEEQAGVRSGPDLVPGLVAALDATLHG